MGTDELGRDVFARMFQGSFVSLSIGFVAVGISLLLPGLIGGSVIFEQIFAWPGLGRLAYEAILSRDFPVIMTLNFIAAVLTLSGTLLSDILYRYDSSADS